MSKKSILVEIYKILDTLWLKFIFHRALQLLLYLHFFNTETRYLIRQRKNILFNDYNEIKYQYNN